MCEILFHGKRVDNGEWVEGFLLICDERYLIIPKANIRAVVTDWLKKGEYAFYGFIEVDPATVGQYTGLTANGKKIFKGDIVVEYDFSGEIFAMGPVEWSDTFVGWQVGGKSMYSELFSRYHIIGNVHDPEIVDVSEEVQ